MVEAGVLVLYVFSNTDPEYYANFLFFVKHGIPGCDSCEYIVIHNLAPDEPVRHQSSCVLPSCMLCFQPHFRLPAELR